MIIKGYWHLYLINNWEAIVNEQLNILVASHLYDSCAEIKMGCIGSQQDIDKLMQLLYPKMKFALCYQTTNPLEYEFATLKLIEQDPSNYVGFYFHLKGVTRPKDTMQTKERMFLNFIMLSQWQHHKDLIETGYDISSVNYLSIPKRFSGNYFWFDRKRLSRLKPLSEIDQTDRFNAEYWIYSKP